MIIRKAKKFKQHKAEVDAHNQDVWQRREELEKILLAEVDSTFWLNTI